MSYRDETTHSSWSQYSEIAEGCPYSFYLKRIERVYERPAAWSAQGTAEHEAYELWERSSRSMTGEEVEDAFTTAYAREINVLLEETPNTSAWFWSGRYDGEADIQRRRGVGLENVRRTLAYYDANPGMVPALAWIDGSDQPMVELEFEIKLGTVIVKGLIDWVAEFDTRTGFIYYPVDYKTGAKPGPAGQLKLYGIALEELYGTPAPEAAFFMTREGKHRKVDLALVSRDEVTTEFEKVDAQIRAGDFPPKPSPDQCRRCYVKDSCKYRED